MTPPDTVAARLEVAFGDWLRSVARRAGTITPGRVQAPEWYRAAGRPVALGMPGIWETWQMVEPWAEALHAAGFDVHLMPQLGAMTDSVPHLAKVVSSYMAGLELEDAVLFGHSKGGLVGKAVLVGPEGWRVRRLIAVATPWDGAPIAGLVPAESTRELLPGSPTITRLAERVDVNERIVQVEATWDQNVPTGRLEGARHVTLPLLGHSTMLDDPDAAALLVELASAD